MLDRIVLHGEFSLFTVRGNFWYQIYRNRRKKVLCSRLSLITLTIKVKVLCAIVQICTSNLYFIFTITSTSFTRCAFWYVVNLKRAICVIFTDFSRIGHVLVKNLVQNYCTNTKV